MKYLSLAVLMVAISASSLSMASDCSVGYAHMKNGKFKQAYTEFRELAERGYPIYMNMMGDMHLKGQGVPPSKVIAHVWYSLSAAQGNEKGLSEKEKLGKVLNDEQLSDSKYFAKEYAQDYLEPYVVSWSLQ